MRDSHNPQTQYFARNVDRFIEKFKGRTPSKTVSHQQPLHTWVGESPTHVSHSNGTHDSSSYQQATSPQQSDTSTMVLPSETPAKELQQHEWQNARRHSTFPLNQVVRCFLVQLRLRTSTEILVL
eukprot:818395-Rhodomonas_salina.2